MKYHVIHLAVLNYVVMKIIIVIVILIHMKLLIAMKKNK